MPATSGRPPLASRVALVLAVLGLVLVAFNQRPSVASVPPVLGRLGLGSTAESLLVTIPVLCFGIGALAGPFFRRVLGEELGVFVLLALLIAAVTTRAVFLGWALFPATIVIGLSIAVLNVLMPSFVKRRFPDRPGGMTSAYVAAATLGPAIAAGLTVPVLHAAHGSVHIALGVWALPAVVALGVWAPQLWAGKARTQAEARETRDTVTSYQPGERNDDAAALGKRSKSMWGRPLAWQVMAYMGIGSLVFYGPLSWLPEIYQSRGLSAATSGYLLLVMNFVGMVGALTAPLFAGRVRDQRVAVIVAAGVTLAGFLGLLFAPNGQAFFWMAVLGIGQGAQFGLAVLMIVLRSSDGHVAARLSGMAQSGGYLIAAAGPLVMGLLKSATGGWVIPIIFLILATVLGLIMGYKAGRDRVIST